METNWEKSSFTISYPILIPNHTASFQWWHIVLLHSITSLLPSEDFFFIHYLQLGRHPVAGVVTCYISTDYEDFPLKFRYGGLHEKHAAATWNCWEPSQHILTNLTFFPPQTYPEDEDDKVYQRWNSSNIQQNETSKAEDKTSAVLTLGWKTKFSTNTKPLVTL